MEILYRFGIKAYRLGIGIASFWNPKAKLWLVGRESTSNVMQSFDFDSEEWVWFHCASLGEFEQGLPLIKELKDRTDYKVVLSFFSPSGYEKIKDNLLVDFVCYIPLDTKKKASDFVKRINPKFAVFVRYEFWHYHLQTLNKLSIPTYLISASFNKNQLFFKPLIGEWFLSMLRFYTKIYTIDSESISLLNSVDVFNCERIGDTRADRVLAILNADKDIERVRLFKGVCKLIVIGSFWESDFDVLAKSFSKLSGKVKWVIAPHEIDAHNLKRIEERLLTINRLRVTFYSKELDEDSNVLVIDNIGLLSTIYKYADIVYVGGGFGKGIHNVLEPSVFANPVVFGINYMKFPEAIGLINCNGGFSISDSDSCYDLLHKLESNEAYRTQVGQNAFNYVKSISGATKKIADEILKDNIL